MAKRMIKFITSCNFNYLQPPFRSSLFLSLPSSAPPLLTFYSPSPHTPFPPPFLTPFHPSSVPPFLPLLLPPPFLLLSTHSAACGLRARWNTNQNPLKEERKGAIPERECERHHSRPRRCFPTHPLSDWCVLCCAMMCYDVM